MGLSIDRLVYPEFVFRLHYYIDSICGAVVRTSQYDIEGRIRRDIGWRDR
jgi:hypothetical protein